MITTPTHPESHPLEVQYPEVRQEMDCVVPVGRLVDHRITQQTNTQTCHLTCAECKPDHTPFVKQPMADCSLNPEGYSQTINI